MPLNFLWVGLSQQNLHHHQPHLTQARQQKDRTRRGGGVRGHLWGRAVFRVRGYSLPFFTLCPPQARRRGFKRISHQDHGACGVWGGPRFPLAFLSCGTDRLTWCTAGAELKEEVWGCILGVEKYSPSHGRNRECLACGP